MLSTIILTPNFDVEIGFMLGDKVFITRELQSSEKIRDIIKDFDVEIVQDARGDPDYEYVVNIIENTLQDNRIDTLAVFGFEMTPNLARAVHERLGDRFRLWPAEAHNGFHITKSNVSALLDAWRQNLPSKGRFELTQRAIDRIVELRSFVESEGGSQDGWIASLSWDSRSLSRTEAIHPKIIIEFFPITSVPAEAIEVINGLEIVFRLNAQLIPSNSHIDLIDGRVEFAQIRQR